jgi:Glycerophosphoryl diester phosphodiesterase family
MLIAARRGNRVHAPENTLISLVSAWTSGADLVQVEVRMTRDAELVVAADPTTIRLTGRDGRIAELSLAELLAPDYDVSVGFPDSGGYRYRDTELSPNRAVRFEPFAELLDELPGPLPLLVLVADDAGREAEVAERVVEALEARTRLEDCVLFGDDPAVVRVLRRCGAPMVGVNGVGRAPGEQADALTESGADAVLTEAHHVFADGGELTEWGRDLASRHAEGSLTVGAVLCPREEIPSDELLASAQRHEFVSACLTDSMLDLEHHRPSRTHVAADFAGSTVDRRRFAFGYAKPHADTRVWQENGVHIEVGPYTGPVELPVPPGLEGRVATLEQQMWYALEDWPFYSGGGLAVTRGIDGDFVAEVSYEVERVAQATTLEMAVVNADPGPHVGHSPRTGRDQDPFYDPHGCPPFVGVEHDEDDGYRVNWNLGHLYLNNQYGIPCGDGAAHGADLRLERRGSFFAAYYRNPGTPGWVCVGVADNGSLNRRVFLRCAGKRWRQERADGGWQEIIPNHWRFGPIEVRIVGAMTERRRVRS